ncbi:MAG: TPR domain-containing protein [Methylocystaceae bacterium]|nr:MAG: TPR domain-containing protein [Methylocystaceae bacterium]KAF0211846.1 MAG: TPR domain-containing [Methylocystaceae bacterium]TXT44141.1 MAG: TPR domain-containing protein [Methylocystaceae bacterium]
MSILSSELDAPSRSEPILAVDPKRLETIQAPYQDFNRLSRASGALETLPLRAKRQFRSYYFFNPPKWRVWARALGSRERMAPSFASIGAVRSGTSFLSSYIFQHPHVVLPLSKEISFTDTMRELMAHFPTRAAQRAAERRNGGAITGYCTPVMPNPLWIFLAQSMFPDMRIICVLRDPVERTFSHWRWDQKRFMSRKMQDPHWKGFPDFETLIEAEKASIRGGGMEPHAFSGARAGYLRHSIYAPFLRLLFEKFGRDRVFIVDAAEFFRDPRSTAKEIYAFLGLPQVEPLVIEEQNPGPPGKLDDGARENLAAFFRPYNEELYALLGRDFGWGAGR